MKFNLQDYEPVEERIKRFYKDHPGGSIITSLESETGHIDFSIFKAEIWVDRELRATGWSVEQRDKEMQRSKSGNEYESVNYSSWLENCETSAIGRALANFNYAGNKRASREEMEKIDRAEKVKQSPRNILIAEMITEADKQKLDEDAKAVIRKQIAKADLEGLKKMLADMKAPAVEVTGKVQEGGIE